MRKNQNVVSPVAVELQPTIGSIRPHLAWHGPPATWEPRTLAATITGQSIRWAMHNKLTGDPKVASGIVITWEIGQGTMIQSTRLGAMHWPVHQPGSIKLRADIVSMSGVQSLGGSFDAASMNFIQWPSPQGFVFAGQHMPLPPLK